MLTINSKLKPQNSSDLFDTSYLTADLKGRSVRGGAITVVSQACKFILQTGSTIVLARLLTPADFGLIAMVTAITNFALMFRDLGLSTATIQKADINHDQISTLFWVNAALGVSVAAVVFALAPAVAWFYDEPRLTPVTMALATTFIFGGLTVQHQAMLQRHMRFFSIGLVEIIAMAVSVVVAVIAALLGTGYWSLVIMHITLAVATAIGKWIAFPWLPGKPKKGIGLKEMLGFGGNITGFNVVNYFARNADNILIGKFIGASALGFYSKAYALLMLPITQLRSPINAVATPALSRLQTEPIRFRNYYVKIISLIAFVSMPLMVYMAIYAEDLIKLILGSQWLPAASIFRVLAIAAFIQPVASTRGLILISLGQGRRYLIWGFANALVTVLSFIIGIRWGAVGVASAYAIANYVILFPSLWYVFKNSPISISNFLQANIRPVIASGIMGLTVLWSYRVLPINTVALTLVCGFGLSVFLYIVAWLLIPGGRSGLAEIYTYGQILIQNKKSA